MLKTILALALVVVALAQSAPNLPNEFSADVSITTTGLPFPVKGKMYYDFPNQLQRIDTTMFGVTQVNVQRYNLSDQYVYATFFGQVQCQHCWLQPPLFPFYIPPLSVYKGMKTINGVQCQEWDSFSGAFGLDFDLYVTPSNTLARAEIAANNVPGVSFGVTMDFSNVVPGPQPSSLFDVPAGCPAVATCQAAMNLVIVLDGSGSISSADFARALQFIQDVANGFSIDSQDVNVGIVQFAAWARVELALSSLPASIKSAAASITQMGTATNLVDGLNTANNMFQTATRQAKQNVILVITDGAANTGGDPGTTAASLRSQGVQIFAIGVGSAIDITQLRAVITQPEGTHLYTTGGFSELQKIISSVVATTCQDSTCTLNSGSQSFTAFPYHTQEDIDRLNAARNGQSKGKDGLAVSLIVSSIAIAALVVAIVAVQVYRRRRYSTLENEMSKI